MTLPACGTCRWTSMTIVTFAAGDVHPEGDQPAMQCRRFPPASIVIDEAVAHVWPTVFDGDWCGEWAPAPDAP